MSETRTFIITEERQVKVRATSHLEAAQIGDIALGNEGLVSRDVSEIEKSQRSILSTVKVTNFNVREDRY